jgi:MOSC domain-containing protein YiiM
VQPGPVAAGDAFEPVYRPAHGVSVADLTRVYAFEPDDLDTMQRILQVEGLPDGWRDYFRERLVKQAS